MQDRSMLRDVAGSLGFALSYWFFPGSHALYRLQKAQFNRLFARRTPVSEFQAITARDCVIQGFRHSGNSFLISNIVPADSARVPRDFHRIWTVRRGLANGAAVIVLVRDPLEVALSTYFRTCTDVTRHTPFRLFPCAVLCGWIGYYRQILKLRHRLTIMPMDLIRQDYARCRQIVLERGGVQLRHEPDWTNRNLYDGARWPVRLSLLSRFLLRLARRQYARLLAAAP